MRASIGSGVEEAQRGVYMIEPDNGGPAFPQTITHGPMGPDYPDNGWGLCGMRLRDYFACAVLQAVVSNPINHQCVIDHQSAAKFAYEAADAMIEERKKRDGKEG